MEKVLGLFGTCGNSKWRDPAIKLCEELGIEYFNPLKCGRSPEDAKIEAYHLANDAVVLFPITNETYGSASLAEIGFLVAQAIKNPERYFVVLVDANAPADKEGGAGLNKESVRTRILVREHLKKIQLPNVKVVEDMKSLIKIGIMAMERFATGKKVKQDKLEIGKHAMAINYQLGRDSKFTGAYMYIADTGECVLMQSRGFEELERRGYKLHGIRAVQGGVYARTRQTLVTIDYFESGKVTGGRPVIIMQRNKKDGTALLINYTGVKKEIKITEELARQSAEVYLV